MAMHQYELSAQDRGMIFEVAKNAYTQQYTPQRLCDLQKILDAQHFYWWFNDMKKEEYACKVFEPELGTYYPGVGESSTPALTWGQNAKYINSFMNTAHMGHQPMVWFLDDTHARGIFFFESNMTYKDNDEQLEHFFVYCHDFTKQDDGTWKIAIYRLLGTKQIGEMRPETMRPPEGYVFPEWEEI